MDLAELRDRLQWLLNFNPTQANQDFAGPTGVANKHIDYLLNSAGREEVRLGKLIYREPFKTRLPLVWTANVVTMEIPRAVRHGQVLSVMDETSTTPGILLPFYTEYTGTNGLYRYDSSHWGWDPAPDSARTLSIHYLGNWVPLVNAGDEPLFIPEDQHDLILWSAAVLGRTVADQEAPRQWLDKRGELRQQYHLLLAKGHPMIYPPTIINFDPNYVEIT